MKQPLLSAQQVEEQRLVGPGVTIEQGSEVRTRCKAAAQRSDLAADSEVTK